jgi:uncharacterized RDD family membrane protein YckC
VVASGTDVARAPSAGFVSRLLALVVDLILLGVFLSGLVWISAAAEELLRPWSQLNLSRAAAAAIPVLIVTYFVASWSTFGQTAGKWLFGLDTVAARGGRVTIGRALLRFAGYLIAAAPLFLGFAWILVDGQRRGLHDWIAGTRVVYVKPRAHAGRLAELNSNVVARDLHVPRPGTHATFALERVER